MALVDSFAAGSGGSRLLMMQARFQQRQQEEKEHKLFAMLEEQHHGGIELIPASRTHSNGSSQNGQHTSASSTASLSSSIGSSLASSLGSTGSGTGGKVRQMFEERRNNINGRPPMAGSGPAQQAYRNGNGYTTKRRGSPPKAGWDRSYPLEPIPPNGHYEKNASRVPAAGQHRYVRPRGVSLERGANHFNEGGEMRRSKSQYQMGGQASNVSDTANEAPLTTNNNHKPKSMNSLNVDGNQNTVPELSGPRRLGSRFGFGNQPQKRSPSEPRYTDPILVQQRHGEDTDYGNANRQRNHINQQTFRKAGPTQLHPNGGGQRSVPSDWPHDDEEARAASQEAQAAAEAAAQAASEMARKLEAEKVRIQAEAKRREEELMNTIRQQQAQLQRLQQQAALAEQKAKAAAAAAASATVSAPRTANVANGGGSRFRKPNTDQSPRFTTLADENDDLKSSGSDDTYQPVPFSGVKKSPSAFSTNEVTASPSTVPGPKPKLAAKPALASKPTAPPRRSIFDTAVAGGKDGLVSCSICGRNFASDRISKHESVCAKSKSKKRKIFDITKMRVKGTEAESYVLNQKPQYTTTLSTNSTQAPKSNHGVGLQNSRPQPYNAPASSISANTSTVKASQATKANMASPDDSEKKPEWKKKHESFIETIRAAKAMQKHLKNGGKLSDLPPPPPSDTSDYIQCPHCKRRFSPGAADRHIPKCANIKSNKPK